MNIYVANLNYRLREEDLKNAFSAFGEVSTVKIVKDKISGRAKGFGFVEMPNDAEASAAISNLDGKDLMGRPLKVNEARPQEPRNNRD